MVETLEEFYKRKLDWMPDTIKNEIGHFNMFRLEPYVEGNPTSIPYRRRDFYKIMLVKGQSQVHFADKVVTIKKQALSFSTIPCTLPWIYWYLQRYHRIYPLHLPFQYVPADANNASR